MKKIVLIMMSFILTIPVFSQKLEQDEIDEFKGTTKRKTSWERLLYVSKTPVCFFRITSYDSRMYFELRAMGTDIVSIPEGAELIFKFDDGTMLTLKARDYVISSRGGGSINLVGSATNGFVEYYKLSDDDINILLSKIAVKVRVYLKDSYFENDISKKHADKIPIAVKLINDKLKLDEQNTVEKIESDL
jgi:hypothetical protein